MNHNTEGGRESGFDSPFWAFAQRFNNFVVKFLDRQRYLNIENEVNNFSPATKKKLEKLNKGRADLHSQKRQGQDTRSFFSEMDKAAEEVLSAEEKQRFLVLLAKAKQNSVETPEEWQEATTLTQRVFDALIERGYNHHDLWG